MLPFSISFNKANSDITTLVKLSIAFLVIWLYFFYTAIDTTDWWIENILVLLFFVTLFKTKHKFMFTSKSLIFIFLFLVLHIYGAKMAYTKNELGEFLQTNFHLLRNPYDRIVHFSFGFLLLFPLNELLLFTTKQKPTFSLVIANMGICCLATIFELIEWGVATFTDAATGETYVATQGDPWDAQKDIVLAMVGAALFSTAMICYQGVVNKKRVEK